MDPIGFLPLDEPSLSVHAMKCCAAVSPQWTTQQTPPEAGAAQGAADKGEWVDWEEMKTLSCDWALAAPLACRNPHCERFLGVVLVGGKNTTVATSPLFPSSSIGHFGPSINPEWLREWSYELAQAIAHASVSVMESSLVRNEFYFSNGQYLKFYLMFLRCFLLFNGFPGYFASTISN